MGKKISKTEWRSASRIDEAESVKVRSATEDYLGAQIETKALV